MDCRHCHEERFEFIKQLWKTNLFLLLYLTHVAPKLWLKYYTVSFFFRIFTFLLGCLQDVIKFTHMTAIVKTVYFTVIRMEADQREATQRVCE